MDRGTNYPLIEMILLSLCACTSDAQGWVDVERYSKGKLDWVRKYFPFENAIPSHCSEVPGTLRSRCGQDDRKWCRDDERLVSFAGGTAAALLCVEPTRPDPHARWSGEGARKRASLPDFGAISFVRREKREHSHSIQFNQEDFFEIAARGFTSNLTNPSLNHIVILARIISTENNHQRSII